MEFFHLGVTHPDTCLVGFGSQASAYLQASFRYRGSDQSQQQLQAPQGNAGPVAAYRAEKPMLHRIPFRRTAGKVAYRDLQVEPVGEFFLEQFLEMPETIAVAPPGVGQDQQFAALTVMLLSVSQPPLPEGIDGELGRIGRDAHVDESVISAHIIYPIRGCLAQGVLREIVGIHFNRRLGPPAARVSESADQLFIFRVDADHGQAATKETLLAPGMARPFALEYSETDGRAADGMDP